MQLTAQQFLLIVPHLPGNTLINQLAFPPLLHHLNIYTLGIILFQLDIRMYWAMKVHIQKPYIALHHPAID